MSGKTQRISKLLVHLGYVETRREAEYFLEDHRVEIDGNPVTRGEVKAIPSQVTIDGEPMDSDRLLILLNKPAGYVCSHEDPGLRVYDLLPERYRARNPKVITVGRLDKDTTGLLLLTDDGALCHKLTHPKYHVPKVYEAVVDSPLTGKEKELFASGKLMLESETTPLLPAEYEATGERSARLTLNEGRYHQVKRMFAAAGNRVTALHRAQQGRLTLGDLPEGKWRLLDAEEEALLFPEV
ncbi:MAG: rRNA pseudouridine synthase [Alphaproteobacteria bacterium]|nr:rRNA pseudouridine synthase [Alphaproteobacteria bacterium]